MNLHLSNVHLSAEQVAEAFVELGAYGQASFFAAVLEQLEDAGQDSGKLLTATHELLFEPRETRDQYQRGVARMLRILLTGSEAFQFTKLKELREHLLWVQQTVHQAHCDEGEPPKCRRPACKELLGLAESVGRTKP